MISYLVFYALEHYIYNLFFVAHSTLLLFFFFFNDTATTEIYTLSLHDALPILIPALLLWFPMPMVIGGVVGLLILTLVLARSEEHTSELQSQFHLVCRLLLEKKNIFISNISFYIIN